MWLPAIPTNLILVQRFFKENVRNYKIAHTNYSVTFTSSPPKRVAIVLSARWIGVGLLAIISQVRAAARRWAEKNPHLLLDKAPPYCFAFKPAKHTGKIVEYDMRHAYLRTAIKLGIIPVTLGKRIAKLQKENRLIVLGALATKKIVEIFENGQMVRREVVVDPITSKVWNRIVADTDSQIREVFESHKDTLFYWYDAIFSKERLNLPRSQFKEKIIRGKYGLHDWQIEFDDGRRFALVRFAIIPQREQAAKFSVAPTVVAP